MRQGNLNDFGAQFGELLYGLLQSSGNLRAVTAGKVFLGQTDAHAFDVLTKPGGKVFHGLGGGGGVLGIVSADGVQDGGGIFHILGDGPNLVQRGGKGYQTVA